MDKDSENKGESKYREGLGVDLYDEGTGVVLGMTQTGEWLEYTVNVTADGEYDIVASVASGSETSAFKLLLDDEEIVPSTTVPKTGEDWSVYKDLSLGKVKLTKGEHILHLEITGDYVNIDWIRIGEDNGSANTDIPLAVKMARNMSLSTSSFNIFDASGRFLGNLKDVNSGDVKRRVTEFVRMGGIYFVMPVNGNGMYKLTIVK